MGKKGKLGKKRQDKFYHRAKIAGFRARSAYKLMQLNTKYEFLQRSQVCIDLCAAPGSWMQVAKKYMPVSSIIVGVDLYPIKPIPGTLSIVGDITTEKVRQELKTTLKTWKADLVLHDGSPNVGQNWLHDAYQQNLLVLHSFKLACEFLQKGGCFLTKVFRSKDYFNLEYIFKKLFKKVEATKPQASRYESSEIFLLCQGYRDPAKIDPQFFSPNHVFQELNLEPNTKLNLLKPHKTLPKAEGYPEGATTLYNRVRVSQFIHSSNFAEVLQEASELYFDDEAIKNHKLTTDAIVENCKDIKVLGRKDLRQLLTWRKSIKADLQKAAEEKEKELAADEQQTKVQDQEQHKEDKEMDKLDQEILDLKTEQAREEKRTRKRKLKERKKLEEKMRLNALIPGDVGPTVNTEAGLFNLEKLSQIRGRKGKNWFSQDIFKDLETEADEDYELDTAIQKYKESSRILEKKSKKIPGEELEGNESGYTSDTEVALDAPDSDTDSNSDSDTDDEPVKAGPQMIGGAVGNGITKGNKKRTKDQARLDPVGLALATKMIYSKKAKRDIMDAGWNRYMFGDDDDLPNWFVRDEKKYNTTRVEVDPEDLRMYRDRSKDVNARTIKKVVEAKARKQRRLKKRLEKARKKAEVVTNNADMTEREKAQEVKTLYKKALTPLKKKEATYVVMKKRHAGKKPKGIKGPYKLVDKRMKKDKRAIKIFDSKKRKAGKGISKPKNKARGRK
nr:pre-rRNA 2'-O-ribose RNA methyltransferase FTSJ3-like [Cherax quadricarinatus]